MEIINLHFVRVFLEKRADSGAATVHIVFHVYSLIKCLYIRLCLWSVCRPSFLLLFSCSGKCNDVNQKCMCCKVVKFE